jgi:hypothetical protein
MNGVRGLGIVILSVLILGSSSLLIGSPASPPELRYAAGGFRPGQSNPPAPSWYRDSQEQESPRHLRYLVAVTNAAVDAEQLGKLREAGATILGYLPVHGYRLRIAAAREAEVRALPFVAWLGAPPAHLKIAPELAARAERPTAPVRLRAVL